MMGILSIGGSGLISTTCSELEVRRSHDLTIGVILASFETGLETITFSTRSEIILWILWVFGFVEMAIFTFRPPWADFFRSDFPAK